MPGIAPVLWRLAGMGRVREQFNVKKGGTERASLEICIALKAIGRLVAVMLRLEGAFNGDADIVCLFF